MNKNYNHLLLDFTSYETETEWLEFKENLENEQQIGEYISALKVCFCFYLITSQLPYLSEPTLLM